MGITPWGRQDVCVAGDRHPRPRQDSLGGEARDPSSEPGTATTASARSGKGPPRIALQRV